MKLHHDALLFRLKAMLGFERPFVCLTGFRILRICGFLFIPKMNNVLLYAFLILSSKNSCQLPENKDHVKDILIYGYFYFPRQTSVRQHYEKSASTSSQ